MTPRQYSAKRKSDGQWVEGWYAVHHLPLTDSHDRLIGYEEVPCLFNDAPGARSGSYWHEIDPATLQQVPRQTELDL